MSLLGNIKKILKGSARVHLREDPAPTTAHLVELIDRFLDDKMRYPLEWDDFISWESKMHAIEQVRNNIGAYERYLFSDNYNDRLLYINKVIEERNNIAAFLGFNIRPLWGNEADVQGMGDSRREE